MTKIFGQTIDNMGRCIHYSSEIDVVANKCYLCKKYYACFHCHDEQEKHKFISWPISNEPSEKIVICGICKHEMDYGEYEVSSECLNCGHLFNENCSMHRHIYFNG